MLGNWQNSNCQEGNIKHEKYIIISKCRTNTKATCAPKAEPLEGDKDIDCITTLALIHRIMITLDLGTEQIWGEKAKDVDQLAAVCVIGLPGPILLPVGESSFPPGSLLPHAQRVCGTMAAAEVK